MDHYVTGATIKALREKHRMTQTELAVQLCVSDKTISKWETGRGFPDVSLLEPLGKALHVSVPELLCGQPIVNVYLNSHLKHFRFYFMAQHVTGGTNAFYAPYYGMNPLTICFGLSWNFIN